MENNGDKIYRKKTNAKKILQEKIPTESIKNIVCKINKNDEMKNVEIDVVTTFIKIEIDKVFLMLQLY